MDSSGNETVLYTFQGSNDGGDPQATLVRDSAGNLYGTAYAGGAGGAGVVFKLDTGGHETVLHNFTGGADGGYPVSGLILDSALNVYGTTPNGGTAHVGVVFKIDTGGNQTVLYTFAGGNDGATPLAGVTSDASGDLYGTTFLGGPFGCGTVFKLDTSANETVLYSFTCTADGSEPVTGVILDAQSNLYGATAIGGTLGSGNIYKLTTGGETTIYSFPVTRCMGNGAGPSNLILHAGAVYGTTFCGGNNGGGQVFKMTTAGQESILYTFAAGTDGDQPASPVIRDSAGTLYGTTYYGGASNEGVVYKVVGTTETVLYAFTGGADGGNPQGSLVLDSSGNLYGATVSGGSGYGVVFKLNPSGQETVLYTFTNGGDGAYPTGGLILDFAGNLYGTTSGGGLGSGLVFKVDPTGTEIALYTFTGGADGAYPNANLVRDSKGNLYGTTGSGGSGSGVLFKVNPTGHQTVLHTFQGNAFDGANPVPVIRDSKGNLYGATVNGGSFNAGTLYKVDSSGNEMVLYSFSGGPNGAYPTAALVRDTTGNLYGVTGSGGTSGLGTLFELSNTFTETTLYTFTGGANGSGPVGVIRTSAGTFYGAAYSGGAYAGGVVFKIH